jgi:DNA repair protein RecO (recombination protein O)
MSAAQRTTPTAAVVLRGVDYGEADRILTLLTPDLGRVAVMARGARKSQRRFGGALEPFAEIAVEIAVGRGEVSRLAGAAVTRSFPGILASLERMRAGGRMLERVRDAVPGGPVDARVFALCVEMFAVLEAAPGPYDALELAVTVRLAAILGFAPRLDRCARCGKEAPPGRAVLYDPRRSVAVCQACGGAPVKLGGATRRLLDGLATAGWATLATVPWPDVERDEVRRVAAALVDAHLTRAG